MPVERAGKIPANAWEAICAESGRDPSMSLPAARCGSAPLGKAQGKTEVLGMSEATPGPTDRPVIHITVNEEQVNNQASTALKDRTDLFHRAGFLVRVVREEKPSRWLKRPAGAPRILPIEEPTLREILSSVASWFEQTRKGDWTPAHPPNWSVSALLRRAVWPSVRLLSGIITAPALRFDGTVIEQTGYDQATGLLYEAEEPFPPIPKTPAKQDAKRAVENLFDLVANFPFADDAHKAAWLAALLTVFARSAIDGPCPLFLFEAAAAGSGKTLLCEIIGLIATGRPLSVSELSGDNEEVRKAITSILLEGDRLVLLDNAGTTFGCTALDAVLTSTTFKGRILGRTKRTPELPTDTVWLATGNNLLLRGDTHRRVIPCRLEPKVERPEERSNFRYPDLKHHVRENRATLVVAALTILRAHAVADRPAIKAPAFGSFEAWCRIVRDAVVWATGHDPCASRSAIAAESRGGEDILSAIFTGWATLEGGSSAPGLTVAEVFRALKDNPLLHGPLREALAEWAKQGKELPDSRQLGNHLRRAKGRVVGGWQLIAGNPDPSSKLTRWWVCAVTSSTMVPESTESTGSDSPPFTREHSVCNQERGESDPVDSVDSGTDISEFTVF